MLRTAATARTRCFLRATAVTAATLAGLSAAATASAAPVPRFGAPYGARSHGSFGVPPRGAAYNGTQAVTRLRTLATATRAASAGGALVTGTQFSDDFTSHLTLTVDGTRATKVQLTGPLAVVVFQSPTKQFVQLDTTDPDVRAALQLLHASNVHYAGMATTDPMINPADMIEQLYDDGAPPISSMKQTEHAGQVQYQIAVNVPASLRGIYPDSAKVTTDRSGRLLAFSTASSKSLNGEQDSVRYGPQTITLPAAQDVVDGTSFDRALVSEHLPEALASVAQGGYIFGLPMTGSETVTQFRAAVRTWVADPNNGMAGIAVTVSDVTNGVTLTARNPFTNVNVTVRAVLDGEGWVSVTDSSGRPVNPEDILLGTPLQLGRTAAARFGVRR